MPDSVKLAVDIHLPSGYMGEGDAPSKFPIVLLYTPYHRSEIDLVTGEVRMAQLPNFEIFTSRGYAFIAADARVASEQTRPLTNVIRDCVTRLWNQRDTSAIAEYLGETCWRHDAGEPDRQFMQFDQTFQHQRAEEGYATGAFDFQFVQMLEGGDFVTMIWDLNYTPSSDELTNRLKRSRITN